MSSKKCHQTNSPCPLAGALDIVGDHWSLLVVRDIMFFEKREYKNMLSSWEGISTNILVDRLKSLTVNGVIDAIPHPESKRRKLYYLTNRGKQLIPAVCELTRWGYQIQSKKTKALHLRKLANSSTRSINRDLLLRHAKWERSMNVVV
ncbi:MAG: winged helix-turn-helix transcriptional regulator [Akkermansiaceae bacterium]